jgi:hypothetical protein
LVRGRIVLTVGALAASHGLESVILLSDGLPDCERNRGDPAGEEIVLVETLRLRKIQQPSKVERLLEACISRSDVLPKGSYQIRNPSSVPPGLRLILNQATEQGKVWSCWTNGFDTWLVTCEMSLALSRERGTPVLQVSLHNKDGALRDSGTWTTDSQGTWHRAGERAS